MSDNAIHMLIADDEQLECDALEFMIGELDRGIVCHKACNGRQAVELAEALRPQIILLDIQMPGMTGLEAAEKIREFSPSAIIVFLTAWGRFDFAQKAIRVGAFDYLVKPADREKLRTLVDKCMSRLEYGGAMAAQEPEVSFDDGSTLQLLSDLEAAVLNGDADGARAQEKRFVESVYRRYGYTGHAGQAFYESFLVLIYDICKAVPFLDRQKPATRNAAELEAELHAFVQEACAAVSADRQDKYRRIFILAEQYIRANFGAPLSVESVAGRFGMQSVYFSRLFPRYCGTTFVEYVTAVRMEYAGQAAAEGVLLKDVAASCGFSDAGYFAKVFHKYYGMSPAEYQAEKTGSGKKTKK